MAKKKSVEKEARWREILQRQAGSGLSVRSFCGAEGISEPSFYAWRRKLRSRNGSGRRTPQKPRGRDEEPDNAQLFVPLTLLDHTPTLEIIHPLGYRIQVSGDVHPEALRQVLKALDERGGP
jgi:transposase-like protein